MPKFDSFADLTSRVHETVLAIRIVKSFGAERFEYARFVERAGDLGRVILKGSIYKHLGITVDRMVETAKQLVGRR